MNVHNFNVKKIDGEEINLSIYKGKTLLIVNTATKCGLAGQFEELEKLYQQFKDKNFVVLGFPCSQFANQEEDNNTKIDEVCKINFGVTFPLFSKIEVNGENADPLYKYLKNNSKSLFTKKIKWNFTKFLVDGNGNIIKRYAPTKMPKVKEIEEALIK